jgi:uncharacterized protein (DUF885 family)
MRFSRTGIACVAFAAALHAGAAQNPGPQPGIDQRRAQLRQLLHDDWEYQLQHYPEMATHAGDYRYNDRLTDYSVQALEADNRHCILMLRRFKAIDTTGFPEQERLNQELMVRVLADQIEDFRLKNWEMPVDQFNGVHLEYAALPEDTPFRSVKDYEDYAARLHRMPLVFSEVTALMRLGMRDHLMQPKYLLQKVAVQAQSIADDPVEKSPFAAPLNNFPKSIGAADRERLTARIRSEITGDIAPAYARFAKFVRDEYAPHGRTELGLSSLPDGDERYRFQIHLQTTTDLTADEIHKIGLRLVAEDERAMLGVAQREGYHDLKSFNEHIRNDKSLYATSGNQLLGLYQHYADQMYQKLPQLFGILPATKLLVVPMEAYREADAPPADYSIGSGDNSRPGRINVNEYQPQHRLLLNVEAIAYHEGIPGHHLQFSIAQNLKDLAPFRKYEVGYNAYVEGWAFYAERLGKDVGFYQDPYSEYGRLEDEMWRAVRLVVDTGVHSEHWTRQQMIDYFHEHTAMDEPNIQTEVDRYIAWPAQALSYKIGQMKILELRERARKQLGPSFDIRKFHDAVLDAGPLPLDVLEEKIDGWIREQQATQPTPAKK